MFPTKLWDWTVSGQNGELKTMLQTVFGAWVFSHLYRIEQCQQIVKELLTSCWWCLYRVTGAASAFTLTQLVEPLFYTHKKQNVKLACPTRLFKFLSERIGSRTSSIEPNRWSKLGRALCSTVSLITIGSEAGYSVCVGTTPKVWLRSVSVCLSFWKI